MNLNLKGLAYIVIATLGFSIIPILASLGLSSNLSSATLLFYRFFIAFLFYLCFCLIKGKKILLDNKKDYLFIIIGASIYSIQCVSFFSSFEHISSSLGEVIFHCYPLFILILAYIFLKEPITKNKVMGVLLSIIGVAIVIYAPWNLMEIRGIIYVFIAAFASAIYMVYSKRCIAQIDTIQLTMYLSFFCALFYFIFSAGSGEFEIIKEPNIIMNVLILAIFSTVIGFFSFMKAISLLKVGEVSILSLMEPIFTIILSFIILGTSLSVQQLVGTIILLLAIVIYEKSPKQRT
ncbi:MAG: DMT family transporter [Erysipelotrichales bacterium]